jgi:hypothetical protein
MIIKDNALLKHTRWFMLYSIKQQLFSLDRRKPKKGRARCLMSPRSTLFRYFCMKLFIPSGVMLYENPAGIW